MNTYYIIMSCMAVMAVIVFVALFYFKEIGRASCRERV